ncbi:19691_t:CDS:2 [Gigaspora margarita]|uniref:19691_t:CDS:1 n=1 Tax=Gigaspora margarita TaxID=4874 RepID=A0ABN7U289_GIGMA|nr:19691_t:CDS:2 [Gigaspora margarita]
MKFLLYNLVFTIILLAILPTGLTQNVPLPLNNFTQNFLTSSSITHSEISIQPNLTGAQPRILNIAHYQDSPTAVVRIARENYVSGNRIRCFERRLLIRVIQANGTIIEINFENIEEIQDINYCLVYVVNNPLPKQPINVYPLFEQYILVTYTHATNTSDNTTFTDRGLVFDWGGNIISRLDFGPSYLQPNTSWYPNEYIVNNITPKKGFLRLSTTKVNNVNAFVWRQYGYDGNGIFSLLSNDTVPNLNFVSFQITVFPTLNDGYAIVYANSTNIVSTSDPLTAQFTAKAGIYAILLTYNQTKTSERVVLYEMNTPNVTFTELRCSVDYVSIGHSCIALVQQTVQATSNFTYYNISTTTVTATRTTTIVSASTTAVVGVPTQFPTQISTPINISMPINNVTRKTFYIRIRFLSSGSVMTLSPIFNITNTNIRSIPLGGYATVLRSSFDQNINFVFFLYDENNRLSDQVYPQQPILANLYGAFDITKTNTLLVAQNETTTFWSLLSINLPPLSPLKDSGYGNLHVITTYPQRNITNLILSTNVINITFQNQISLSDGNLTVYQIINQTNILRQRINSRTCDLSGKVLLTNSGTIYFKELNVSGRYEFFTSLIKELTVRIPIEPERLSTNGRYQTENPWSDSEQILIPIFIKEARNNDEKLTVNVRNDLDTLVKQKQYTGIGTGTFTKFLDENYGFKQVASPGEFFEIHKPKFIILLVAIILCLTLFIGARYKSPESQNFIILQFGITIFRIVTTTVFVFTDARTVQNLFIPGVIFLMLPIAFNLTLAFSILFSEHNKEFTDWFAHHGRIATTVALISGAYIDMLLILKSHLLKLKVFDAPLSNKSLTIIFWGACTDIFLGDIPQLIIQIIYIYYTIEYDITALFTIIASGLSTLSNVLSKLFFIKFDKLSPYHKEEDQSDNSDDLGKSNLEEPFIDRSVEQRENSGERVEKRENPEELGSNSESTNVEG